MNERAWPPSENCYCGGPEEIYPHRYGTGFYCRRKAAESNAPASAATETLGETQEGSQ
jgi:hypothetical protein